MSTSSQAITQALAEAGLDERFRNSIFEALRLAERQSSDPIDFRNRVRWPIIQSLLQKARTHQVVLSNGLIFEVGADSRIEQALLLSAEAHPDHVWEPQTTKLLLALSAEAAHVIVGGAYIGDQVLPMARAMAPNNGAVHAFEPMRWSFSRLLRHLQLNQVTNVYPHRACLWDSGGSTLTIRGDTALATSLQLDGSPSNGETAESMTVDEYVDAQRLTSVGVIMLDTEGGEHRALLGSSNLLSRGFPDAPNVVFEVHRSYIDWSEGLQNTPVVELLAQKGYTVFAIRDFHDNYGMRDKPIEVIPVDRVYLEGPPHGFNLLATKDDCLVRRLGLRITPDVSPKLLIHKDPALHHPLDGL